MEFLQALEQFGPAQLLRSSFVAYPLVNAIHIAAVGALFTSVLLMDLAWLGAIRTVPRDTFVTLLRRVAFLAFSVAALTGLALFSIQATSYALNPAFLMKLGLIALALLNLLVFTVLDRRNRRDTPSPAMRLCAIVSILLWSGVVVAGRFIGFL